MADIHQYSQYEKLVRRIGYSVGLEDPIERINWLVDLYVEEKDINLALWKSLVRDRFGRKISDDFEIQKWAGNKKNKKKLGAEDHFADFYSELNLIYRTNNQILPLYGLEILSILKRLLPEDKYMEAIKGLLLLFFIEADGDILLNCLLANFDKEATKEKLENMFRHKRDTYLKVFSTSYSRSKLLSIFRVQTAPVSSSAFERRSLNIEEIEIPEDYLSKVIPTRRGWSSQLQLLGSSQEGYGVKLITFLQQKKIINESWAAFYCYAENHKALLIDNEKFGIPSLNRKDFMRDFFLSHFGKSNSQIDDRVFDRQIIYDLLSKVMELYKKGNKVKGMLRHQLPLQIMFPIFYIVCCLENLEYIDFEMFLNEEQKSPDRKLDLIHLRGGVMEGAISLK